MKSFTLVIDSNKRKSGNTNDCFLEINCPQSFSKLSCEVYLFSIAYPSGQSPSASYIKLVTNTLDIQNQYSNNNKQVLTIYDNRNYRYARSTFNCDNFNAKLINFQLLDENDQLLLDANDDQFNFPWIMILKCTSMEN